MPDKDDFFGDDSRGTGSEDASLDDFFQPAVQEEKPKDPPKPKAQQPPKQPAPPLPPKKSATPPPPPPPHPSSPPPTPALEDFAPVTEEMPPSPSIEEELFPIKRDAVPPPPPPSSPPPPTTQEAEPLSATTPQEVVSQKPTVSVPEPKGESNVKRILLMVTGVLLALIILGGGGYFGYTKFLQKKTAPKLPKVVTKPAPIEKPQVSATTAEPTQPQPATTTVPSPTIPSSSPFATQPTPKQTAQPKPSPKPSQPPATPKPSPVQLFTPPPLPELPPVKSVAKGKWTVHLERLALLETLAKDSEKVRKAGFEPYRVPEARSTRVIEYKITISFDKVEEANNSARKILDMGYRPTVVKVGKGARIIVATVFSEGVSREIVAQLTGSGFQKVEVEKRDNKIRLNALRVGPYDTEAQAREVAEKLKQAGFPGASVIRM